MPIGRGWEIGYHIGKDYTRKGYAVEAVKAFLPVIMVQLGLNEIYGICHAGNTASRKVLEKCGFLIEFDGMGPLHGEMEHICRYKAERPGRDAGATG
jgi:ribosomal-protein-alanine N-acetyltransferase